MDSGVLVLPEVVGRGVMHSRLRALIPDGSTILQQGNKRGYIGVITLSFQEIPVSNTHVHNIHVLYCNPLRWNIEMRTP